MGLPGNQVIVEALIADVLNEHFGESVELVGVALFRDGQMTFPELVRICTMSFLAMPRDALNPYTEYSRVTFGTDTIGYKTIRDSLLVLIHHGLVSVVPATAPTVYRLKPIEVFNRLLFPLFIEPFDNAAERTAVEHLITRSMTPKSGLVDLCEQTEGFSKNQAKEAVAALQGRRVIVSVDSLVTTSPTKGPCELVVRLNSSELQLDVVKRYMVDYVAGKHGSEYASVLQVLLEAVCSTEGDDYRSRVSIGSLSVSDLSKKLKLNNNQLISALIELQNSGLAARQQQQAPVTAPTKSTAGRKRKAPAAPVGRAKNTKQLLDMVEDDDDEEFNDLLGASSQGTTGAAPSYCVRFFDIIEEIESEIVFQILKAKYGSEAARVFELLSQSGQKYEASHVADICAIAREDALKYLHGFAKDGLCQIQEVPKVTTSASAASAGVSAMMRAVASSFWLYSVDADRVRRSLISLLSNSIVNLRRRFRFEVNRQCRIEDRASVLTKPEQMYLETVHAAQDTLEGNSIQLVSSLLILLLRAI